MQEIAKPLDLISELRQMEPFADIEPEALEWLIDRSAYVTYEQGELLFQPGTPTDRMVIVLAGEYLVQLPREGELQELGKFGKGDITGVLPFSRMKETRAFGRVLERVESLELHRDHFVEMVTVSYQLTQNLVGLMSDRIRDFTGRRYQDDKLMALGKLSAGLAHELNNPASSIVRNAKELRDKVHQTPEKFKSIITMRITPEQTDRVNEILFGKIEQGLVSELSTMERTELEEELLDWLEEHEVENPEDLAETFADFNLGINELQRIADLVDEQYLGPILWWVESTLSLEILIGEIREASDRIARLIHSVKTYSHMDRGAAKERTNIHDGLISTLIMLKHKLKAKQIKLVKELDYTLPPFNAFVGELNQVWTNLLDNAIDAMSEGGTLHLKSYADRHFICVEITDNGSGIPEEVIDKIFDPFFTTKGIGEGTGMGLDIVKKIIANHKGDIRVESQPGKTTFLVCLPTQNVT